MTIDHRVTRRGLGILSGLSLGLLALSSCTPGKVAPDSGTPSPADPRMTPTDYSDPTSWLEAPEPTGKAAATFFLVPTCYFGDDDSCAVTDSGMREQAGLIRDRHAGIFAATDFYAPYYRQLSIPRVQSLGTPEAAFAEIDRIPLVDAQRAFVEFLDSYAQDRPIVLASHSQGTMTMLRLIPWIREQHPTAHARIVAAYLIGFPVPDATLDTLGLPFATRADDTGCVISWSSESPGTGPSPFVTSPPGRAINPVTWTSDPTEVPRSRSRGARLEDGHGGYVDRPHFASARVDRARGTVVTDAPVKSAAPWPAGVLHHYDYDLWYYDFQANVDARLRAYSGR